MAAPSPAPALLEAARLDDLLEALRAAGHEPIGPVLRDGSVVRAPLGSADELPVGLRDHQRPGSYRLEEDGDGARFGVLLPGDSWKRELFPPQLPLFTSRRDARGRLVFTEPARDATRRALIGVRPCELRAIAIQDRVLLDGPYRDEDYATRRANLLTVVVQCGRATDTCFCTSMGGGPRATEGFDLALTELIDDRGHRFVVEAGSAAGRELLERLALPSADAASLAASAELTRSVGRAITRKLDAATVRTELPRHHDDPHWAKVAARCLQCGNCTLACPTCFCIGVDESNALDGGDAGRSRHWDSCFNSRHGWMVGGSIRTSPESRYRQWITHKLSSWHEQFGTGGCVGCGRCITWCPVGIDITAEALAATGGH